MSKNTNPFPPGRFQVFFAAGTALVCGSSLALAQAAPPPPPAAPETAAAAQPAPAGSAAPTATESSTPLSAAGSSVPVTAAETTAPSSPPPAQPTAGAAVATTAEASLAADAEIAAQAEVAADAVTEEISGDVGKLNLYGFVDFTYANMLSDRSAFNTTPIWYPSFYVGNLNLYLDSDLGRNWHTLSEVRFTYLPDGVNKSTFDATSGSWTATRTSGAYPDYADFDAEKKVGGVIIERAYLEYAAHPLLTIRGGQFLTPYGIWNVEHGTTVIVGTTRPYVVGANLFPAHQTGLEFYGSYGVSSTQVGYHLTLSNGRGPVDTYRDMDKNTAVGWRLWVQQDTDFGTFTLGTSGYKGRYTDRLQTAAMGPDASGKFAWTYNYAVQSEYRELALALDLKWTWKGALFQSEAMVRDQVYDHGTRPVAMSTGGPTAWTPDQRTAGFYALAGYRLPWMGIMPYFGGEYYYLGKNNFFVDAMAFWGGFNIRPTDRVVLKLQATHAIMYTDWLDNWKKPKPMDLLTAQAAWSF